MTHQQFNEIAHKLIAYMVRTSTSLGLDGEASRLDAIARLVGVDIDLLKQFIEMMRSYLS